jgi:predicted nucleic acid-binding Zn ribbon protein
VPIYNYVCNKCGNEVEVITTSVSKDKILNPPLCECCGMVMKRSYGDFGFKMVGECNAADGYTYEYTKCKAGEEKVKPVYSKKKVAETMEKIKNSMKEEMGNEEV